MKLMARKDTVLLFVPAIIGVIIIFSIFLLDIQLANFKKAYFQEIAEETRHNNAFLVRAFRELLETKQLDKMRRMLSGNHGPNPMIVKIIARGKGAIMESEGVPGYLSEHIREPEIKNIFKGNRDEDVVVKFDRTLNSFMVYHSVRFRIGEQDYVLVMASKCNSMTLLMRQTRRGILILTALGVLSTLALVTYFCYWIRSPLNRLFASMSKIAAGELEYPVYVPRSGLIREIALCLQTLTEQLKKQIVSLRDDANERKAILNSLTEAVLLVDAAGKIGQWNRTACELFFPGTNPECAALPDCPEELRECIRKTGEHGAYSGELILRRGDREYQLLVNAVSFVRDEQRFFLISATDLSEIRKLEAYRREFIAAISHEMKTPLTGIVGAVDAINSGALDREEYKVRCIDTLTKQSERLHTLLVNFLTLTSLENTRGRAEDDFLPVRPLAVVRSAIEVCRPVAEAAGITVEAGPCVSAEFPGDALLLQQALNNLIANAVLHSGTERIEVSASATEDGRIDFCVRDYGCGIPAEHQDRIFKRFYRVPSGSRKQPGSGIGLAIVKHVALYHHGTVFVRSVPGQGAEFHIVLPAGNPGLPG